MRLHGKGWAFAAAVALVVGVTSTALAIEAFQERFEWGDMSKPTTLQGRVIILDPYDEAVWEQLKSMARPHAGPAAAKEVPPASATTLIEFAAQEVEQNRRVISSVKKLPEIAGDPAKPRGIRTLKEAACQGKDEFDKACYEAKKTLNTSPKGKDTVPMQYDVMLPGGKTLVSGITPWSANEDTGAGH